MHDRFSPCFGSTMVDTGPEPLTDAFRANFSHKFSREFCMRIARKVAPVNHGRQGSQRPSTTWMRPDPWLVSFSPKWRIPLSGRAFCHLTIQRQTDVLEDERCQESRRLEQPRRCPGNLGKSAVCQVNLQVAKRPGVAVSHGIVVSHATSSRG